MNPEEPQESPPTAASSHKFSASTSLASADDPTLRFGRENRSRFRFLKIVVFLTEKNALS